MAKISAFDQYKDAKVRRQQVVYLHANGFTNDQIAKIAGYAKSTVANYVKKFADFLADGSDEVAIIPIALDVNNVECVYSETIVKTVKLKK